MNTTKCFSSPDCALPCTESINDVALTKHQILTMFKKHGYKVMRLKPYHWWLEHDYIYHRIPYYDIESDCILDSFDEVEEEWTSLWLQMGGYIRISKPAYKDTIAMYFVYTDYCDDDDGIVRFNTAHILTNYEFARFRTFEDWYDYYFAVRQCIELPDNPNDYELPF